ncbi:HNH endonuclease [uncultured Dialister sp.]|uniref:HNH endonuclease n=1 Tax=Dialister succinatiphilus TaxID=487173 RepID=UPI00265DF5B2|nr:HNH endonuclease [uncultured Dialister sp.]
MGINHGYTRNPFVRKQGLIQSTHKPYIEGHHIIPMVMQPSFDHSLDVYANIICLCPICHRKIHLGIKEDRKDMLKEIYDQRGGRFEKSGLRVTEDEFIELGLR